LLNYGDGVVEVVQVSKRPTSSMMVRLLNASSRGPLVLSIRSCRLNSIAERRLRACGIRVVHEIINLNSEVVGDNLLVLLLDL